MLQFTDMDVRRTDLPEDLQNILAAIDYVTIATICADGQPWNTPVFGRFDDNLNLYWVSHKQAQHSQNIAREPRIFVVIYDSTVPEGGGLAVYLKMRAQLLSAAAEIMEAQRTYDTKFFAHDFAHHEQFLATDCPQGFYRAIPEEVWRNSDGTIDQHFIDQRTKIK